MPFIKAKMHCNTELNTAQHKPVTIDKKCRPIAVVISKSDFKTYPKLKLETLQRDLMGGITRANEGKLIDSDEAFKGLL